jgi:hypothetical protein
LLQAQVNYLVEYAITQVAVAETERVIQEVLVAVAVKLRLVKMVWLILAVALGITPAVMVMVLVDQVLL